MTAFMGSSINIALPVIGKEFNATAIVLSWLSTAYLVSAAALLLPIGKLTDIYGRTKFFRMGIILFTVGSLLCGYFVRYHNAFNFENRTRSRRIIYFQQFNCFARKRFPSFRTGKSFGNNYCCCLYRIISGPFLGGMITHYFNWRDIFFINAFIGIALIIITAVYLKQEWQEMLMQKYDYRGAAVYIISIILLMLSVSMFPNTTGFILLFVSVCVFGFFYFIELHTPHPILNAALFKSNKTFALSNLAALINYSATYAIGFLMSFYLQSIKILSPQEAGTILITQPYSAGFVLTDCGQAFG